jgi:undecaprenyl-diphosphatase
VIPLRAEENVWKRVLSLDERLLLSMRRWEDSHFMTRFMRSITHLGDPASWVLLGLALSFSGVEGPRYFALVGIATGFALAISQLLKRVCRRQRPDCGIGGFAALAENPDSFSFPSGHTAVAFAVAAAFAGQPLGILVLVFAAGIAVSRVYLGAHYPLDVAAGMLLGTVAGTVAKLLVVQYPLLKFLGYASLGSVLGP